MTDPNKKDIDQYSGIETTGHEWDGLKELNNPLPRWWLWCLYATIIWSVVYFVMYPSWPTLSGNTEGTTGYTQYRELAESQREITDRQAVYLAEFERASFAEVLDDPELYAFAYRGGETAFKDNCATCHGTGGAGAVGYPALVDDDWLWGGTIDEIETTIRYGIRAGHDETRYSEMPAFAVDQLLTTEQIGAVTDHVLALSNPNLDASAEGAEIFENECVACHAEGGKGDKYTGAPNLSDAIWLYGGERDTVMQTISKARFGVMPNWDGRLDQNTIRQLAFYVHQLGGGVVKQQTAEAETSTVAADAGRGGDR